MKKDGGLEKRVLDGSDNTTLLARNKAIIKKGDTILYNGHYERKEHFYVDKEGYTLKKRYGLLIGI